MQRHITPSSISVHRHDLAADAPPSPTMSTNSFMSSMSWMAEKSTAELIPLLKNAYHSLKDKERDLMLAAEIGKSLLENNIAMKQRYEQLLTHSRAPLPDALPTPSSSVLTNQAMYDENDDNDSDILANPCQEQANGTDDDDEDDTMGFVSSRSTREAMIEVLETRNRELTMQLDALMDEQAALNKSKTKQHRALEEEISHLTRTLDMATTKIQELEKMDHGAASPRANRMRKGSHLSENEHGSHQGTGDDDDDDDDDDNVDTLLSKIEQLQLENNMASKSKHDLERKLASTLQDLRQLKTQFDHFQFTRDDHEKLQQAYERQFRHIDELNATVEEHRTLLQKLKDRGISISSAHTTPAPSCINGDDMTSEKDLAYRQTLLAELENEWRKQQQPALTASASTPTQTQQHALDDQPSSSNSSSSSPKRPQDKKKGQGLLQPSWSHLSLQDLPTWNSTSADFETMLARAAGVDQQSLEDAIQFVNRLESSLLTSDDDVQWSDNDDEMNENDDMGNGDRQWLVEALDLPREGLYPTMPSASRLGGLPVGTWMRHPATAATTSSSAATCTQITHSPRSFTGRIQSTARALFRAVWRWCRFAVVLTTAVLISVWNGPDQMLLEN
ncbi:hypothetical protein BC940DRAFT_348899 [Gongronella butleri]|nr:hypothetical protein BC940DRAFT_348899 [Gongronella butleri]